MINCFNEKVDVISCYSDLHGLTPVLSAFVLFTGLSESRLKK
jgi:hypothetical protein